MSDADIQLLIGQLSNKASAKRRSAAKKLRKLKVKEAGPALLAALKNELKDKRTWETQYQMIMALGEAGYTDSLDFLIQLADQEFEATTIYIAIGDAIAKLTYLKNSNIKDIIRFLDCKNNIPLFIDGLIRAVAILKLVPSPEEIEKIITYGNRTTTNDNNRTWIASAAAGWTGGNVETFLNKCSESENQQTKKAAEAALRKRYLKWDIL